MAPRVFADAAAQSTCATPITAVQTTITLVSAAGFPTIPSGTVLDVIILDSGNPAYSAAAPLATPYEYQGISSIAGNVLTINGGVRATYAGTTPKAFFAGATIAATPLQEGFVATFPIKISEAVLSGLSTTFPSVAVTGYRSLLVTGNFQGNGATVDLGLQFNGDTANNYSYLNLFNIGGGPSGGVATITNNAVIAQAPLGSSATFAAYISNYSQTLLANKPVISYCSGAGIVLVRGAYWNQAAAITSIVAVTSGNMIAGSLLEVFGIP